MSRRAHTGITSSLGVCVTLDPEPDEYLIRLDYEHRGEIISVRLKTGEARKLADVIARALDVTS